ncbi:DUF5993 family protein [Microbulbifer sp. A4B17]|uniref:DUF5993 family protein n=1 Tax=Microbulbifer sp. A4B17 TaxID=359370 RepID=UPI001300AB0E|nr:DUF5993 family protein [Microbulbifer sp. A4B17]
MMSLLFLFYLLAMSLAIKNYRSLATATFIFALVLSFAWLGHHASSTLDLAL